VAKRILLVDDDIAEISAVKRVLLRAGHDPVLATNTSDALASIAETAPDVVLIATACESGEGAALARDLASGVLTLGVPLLLIGASVPDLDAPALTHPVDAAALHEAVRSALASRRVRPAPAVPPLTPSVAAARPQRSRGAVPSRSLDALGPRVPSPPQASVQRRASEEARAAVADAARRRVLATAKERSAPPPVAAGAEPQPPAPELLAGSLATTSMPRLLALAAQARVTGRLDVQGEPRRGLWLEGGRVVGAVSSAPQERTDEVALRLGLVTREQAHQIAADAAGLASRRIGILLLERGFLKPTELALLARRRAEEVVFATFSAQAPYRLTLDERVPPDERLALERRPLALAVEGVRRRWAAERLDAVLGGAATLLEPAPRPPSQTDLGLSPDEARVAELADGLRTLEEIVADAAVDPLSARQVLAALVEVGALQVKILAPREAPAPEPSTIDLARIYAKLDQVRRADYFAILGLGRACTPYEVREAAARLFAELDPERFAGVTAEGLGAKLDEITRVVREARDVLSDDALRAEYVSALGDA
jgi:CheY-like chemotaxis protein